MCVSLSPRFNGLDRVIAGLWYWKLRRNLAERKINDAPEQTHRIDEAYQEWTHYEFACRFGRPTDREIASAVLEAEKNGGDVNALGLVITNRDASVRNGHLQYRNGYWLKALSYLAFTICLGGSIMFATLLALAPIPLPQKLLAFCVIFALLIGGAYVFELYTSRPLAAVKKLQAALDQPTQANIISLQAHPAFKGISRNGHPE
jgi:hypothetical protein